MKLSSVILISLCLGSVLSTTPSSFLDDSLSASDMDGKNLTAFYPAHFDCRTASPNCPWIIYEEGICASSWAIAISDTFSSLECTVNQENFEGSIQQLLDCVDPSNQSCVNVSSLTTINDAFTFLTNTGITNNECYPYSSQFTGSIDQQCETRCANNDFISNIDKLYGVQSLTNVNTTKTFMMDNGPVFAAYKFYDDLLQYTTGVYSPNTESIYLGYHYGKIVGWGTSSNGEQYWTIANTWGTFWGTNGYFNMYMNEETFVGMWGFNVENIEGEHKHIAE